jgi:hypothetical protein
MEPSAVAKISKTASLKVNQAIISGRVDTVRTFEQQGKRVFEHRILLAAKDTFSNPSAVLVHSSFKIGAAGEDIEVPCDCSGWRDSYKDKEGNTIQTARNALKVCE